MERARFRALVLGQVEETLEAWKNAWASDDARGIADFFTPGGMLLLHQEPYRGPGEIRDSLANVLSSVGPLSFSLTDFEAGGSLAMVWGSFLYRQSGQDPQPVQVSGHCLTVLLEENGQWKIRSQLFRPLELPSGSRMNTPHGESGELTTRPAAREERDGFVP